MHVGVPGHGGRLTAVIAAVRPAAGERAFTVIGSTIDAVDLVGRVDVQRQVVEVRSPRCRIARMPQVQQLPEASVVVILVCQIEVVCRRGADVFVLPPIR